MRGLRMKWLRARLSEPSTYAGLAGLCLAGCFLLLDSWVHWRALGIAGGALFVISAAKADRRGN